jgi:putative transposase
MSNETPASITLGSDVVIDGVTFTLIRYIDLYSILAVRIETGERVRVSVAAVMEFLAAPPAAAGPANQASSGFEGLTEDQWAVAQSRAAAVSPFLTDQVIPRSEAKQIATGLDVHVATLYRWINKLKATGRIADLAPAAPEGGRGKIRIDPVSDGIMREAIEAMYLTNQKVLVSQLMTDIEARCRRAGVDPPHANTVRRRVEALSERLVMERRMGRKAADDRFAARPGQFPGADYPGAYWQIDHTPLDVVLVDDVHRRHIGRPWLTLAIDVYSRCVAGFYLSLDAPSEVSVGMCLVHAILPKDGWLASIGAQATWPMWGKPSAVHADNGKEFHGTMITRAAEQHRFRMEWRKVKTPNWGGHIERLMGTFSQEMHTLPGTTFANTQQRGTYAPHKEAVLTFAELELYLSEYICGMYHQRVHSGIGRPPLKRLEYGLLGDGTTPGRGIPPPVADPKRLRLDFLPLIERTVQRYGIQLDNIHYYHPVLDQWVRAQTKDGKLRKFIVRRDPRDISVIHFLDPSTDTYYAIPYRQVDHPAISLWELREVMAQLRREGKEEVDEDIIFETYDRLSRLVDQAKAHTVKARKAAQKKRSRGKTRANESAQEGRRDTEPAATQAIDDGWDSSDDAAPYSDIRIN